eukprot:5309448-Prymnesium_polylepis.1
MVGRDDRIDVVVGLHDRTLTLEQLYVCGAEAEQSRWNGQATPVDEHRALPTFIWDTLVACSLAGAVALDLLRPGGVAFLGPD